MTLNFETTGTPGSPALLMLHGFMSCRYQWTPNLAALAARYHIVTVDLWGHGGSPAPEDEAAYLPAGYASAFEAIRQDLGINSWAVCGQSFGAGLIIRYAHTHADSVSAIVTTNSRSAFAPTLSERAPKLTREEWKTADLRRLPFHPRHARRFPARLRERLSDAADRLDRTALWYSMAVTGPRLSCLDILPELRQPFLLVNGTWEKRFQPERAEVQRLLPSADIVDLEGGHSINIENPAGFDRAVIDFLG